MNNEIKEILECLEKYGQLTPDAIDDLHYIRDYITNLQEENERLKEWKKDLLNENIELEHIIKEAINYIDDNTYYKDHKGHINIDDVYIILQGEDKDE